MPPKSLSLASAGSVRAAEEATGRFKETARLANERLEQLRSDASMTDSLPPEAAELISKLQWVACMLLNTAEDALKAKTSLLRSNEQQAIDQLERAHGAMQAAEEKMESALGERDFAQTELQALGSKIRKDGLSTRQRQAKDASRVQALQEQVSQLQANLRLSEAAWAEERRAEQASASQRERNFQQVIVKLQHELDAAGVKAQKAGTRPEPPPLPPAQAEELASLRARAGELQAQCDRGVSLIERLKARLQASEKEKESLHFRERDLAAQLTGSKEQRRLSTLQAQEAHEQASRQIKQLRRESGPIRDRYEMELRLLGEELDSAHAVARSAEERARAATVSALAAQHKVATAEVARAEAEARSEKLGLEQQKMSEQAQQASSGAVNLLRAALSESQRKLTATQRAYAEVATELADIRAGAKGDAPGANNGTAPANSGARFTTPSTLPPPVARVAPTPRSGRVASSAEVEGGTGGGNGDDPGLHGLGRLRASLLDSLRAERTKLERERALLGR